MGNRNKTYFRADTLESIDITAMKKNLHLLIIEDSESDAKLVVHALQSSGYMVHYERVERFENMKTALQKRKWDVVISDYNLPAFSAPKALETLQSSGMDIPFIVVSGTIGEDAAVALMKAGAHDYIMKGNLLRLVPAVEREIQEAKTRLERRKAEQALADERDLLRTLLDNLPDRIYFKDLQSRFTRISKSLADHFGIKDPSEAIGKTDFDYFTEKHARIAFEAEQKILSTGEAIIDHEEKETWPDGQETWVGTTKMPWKNQKNQIIGTYGISNDITKRKEAEERIQAQLRQLTSLYSVETVISSTLDLRQVLDVLLKHVILQFSVDATDILLWNEKTQKLEFAAGSGFHTDLLQQTHLGLGDGYAGRAALDQRVIYVPDVMNESSNLSLTMISKNEQFKSYYGVPLIAKGKIKGVLELFRRERYELTIELQSFLNTLANQAAIAVDSLELFNQLHNTNLELEQAYDRTLEGWSFALDIRDKESENHSQRVTLMTEKLARQMGFSDEELIHIRRGALLHDIGKLGIPDSILLKSGELTEEERKVIQLHPLYAYDWISPIAYLRPALDIPYCHHEKWDGTGYPRGLKGEEIPLAARIFAVIDVWDALNSNRPYRSAWPVEKIVEFIHAQAGIHFDPKVVEEFFKMIHEEDPIRV
jgi:PAS domain S-box-containing protein